MHNFIIYKTFKKTTTIVCLGLFLIACTAFNNKDKIVIDKDNDIIIENGKVKAHFQKNNENKVVQTFYAKNGNDWQQIATSFIPQKDFPKDGVQLFNEGLDPKHRFLVNSNMTEMAVKEEGSSLVVTLKGTSGTVPIQQTITLNDGNDYFHFDVSLILEGKPAKLDYALSTFTFNHDRAPEFVHTPGLKFDNEDSKQNRFKLLPGKDQVIGDRAYHAPAVILQEKAQFTALVPDLNAINNYKITSPDARKTIDIGRNQFSAPFEDENYTMPTGLDLNIMTGLTEKPVMTFGYMDNIIAHHIRYQRVNDESMVRTLNDNHVRYAFDLFVSAEMPRHSGFQRITTHQWEKFGKPVFDNRLHLAMPFEEYFRIIDSITFNPIASKETPIDLPLKGYKNTGSWLEWEDHGEKIGGYRSAIGWWNDVMHNSAFWNNAREAQGFWYWGHHLNRPEMLIKSKQIINWCLSAPKNEQGLFALLYNANDKSWVPSFTDPVNGKNVFFLRKSDSYDISTMSKTAAHLVDFYLRCEKDERIIDYFTPYANWLLTAIDERGAVPSYVDKNGLKPSPILHYSAQPSSSMWFLAEMYNVTNNQKYLEGAKKIERYLEKEILPEQKWVDMEQFFSCGNRPFEFERDRWQNQVARGNLALFWAIEGYAALYLATKDESILKKGEQCVDYVTFSQACWEPHYIYTAFAFGGFTVDNADNATYLDARQAEMVRPFAWYGKQLGRQDLLERSVAAARSSVVLMNHPRHKSNNIYRHTNIYPFGLGPENIDHEAHPQSAMRTHPSWGEGSGVFTGLAEAGRAFGGVYLNFEKHLFVGANGIRVKDAKVNGNTIKIQLENQLGLLTQPWEKVFVTDIKIQGLQAGDYELVINDKFSGDLSYQNGVGVLKISVTSNGDFKAL